MKIKAIDMCRIIRAERERESKRKCMDCTWFKTDPNDLPDFGKCVMNHCDVISSDKACADFRYPKGGKEIIGKELYL